MDIYASGVKVTHQALQQLVKNQGSSGEPERHGPELKNLALAIEAKIFPCRLFDRNMEVSVLQVYSSFPHSIPNGGNNAPWGLHLEVRRINVRVESTEVNDRTPSTRLLANQEHP
ncbi:hypothetical protein CI610_02967 [invertebrate metagenome]|uniref:Uncharacterized protein n=1 Tax=invertebrate metagenome TaxID=1711999 RepID=A0A2H9T4G5_9ZZZZ